MKKFLAIIHKEFLLLWRDKIGLLVLFILPTVLVLFISLIQPGDGLSQQHIKVLLLNQDQSHIGDAVSRGLHKISLFDVTSRNSRSAAGIRQAKKSILQGKQQVLVIVPPHASAKTATFLRDLNNPRLKKIGVHSYIPVYIDATLPGIMSTQIKTAISLMLVNIQLDTLINTVRQTARAPQLKAGHHHYIETKTQTLQGKKQQKASIAQQNVPAWSLFGMFFIVIPLASIMIRERTQGIGQRLFLTPASTLTLFLARFVSYGCVNLLQLIFMLLIGVFILPLFGIAALTLLPHLFPVLVTGICAACAATSFGIFLGTLLRTQQQASFLGPFVVIIGAAMGGIFVPVSMMPAALLHVIHYSPLYWAQSTFLEILVRDGRLVDASVYTPLLKLICFSVGAIICATLLGKLRKPHTRTME